MFYKSCRHEGYNVLFLMMLVQLRGLLSAGCGLWSCCWVFLLLMYHYFSKLYLITGNRILITAIITDTLDLCTQSGPSYNLCLIEENLGLTEEQIVYILTDQVRLCATLCVTISWLPVANTLELYSTWTLGLYWISVQQEPSRIHSIMIVVNCLVL